MKRLDLQTVDGLSKFFDDHHAFSFKASAFDRRLFCKPEKIIKDVPSVAGFVKESYRVAADYYRIPENDVRTLMLINEVSNSSGMKDREGSGGGFHTDSIVSRQIKTFAYLTDVLFISNGPFTVAGRLETMFAHVLSVGLTGKLSNRFDHSIIARYLEKKAKPVLGNRGHAFSCDTRAAHKGQPVDAAEPRRMLTMYMYQKNSTAFQRLSEFADWE